MTDDKVKEWVPDFAIEIVRDGNVWLAFAPALKGNLAVGKSLDEVLTNWCRARDELHKFMREEVASGKAPTTQFEAYERLLGVRS